MARYSVDIQAQLKGFTEIESKLKKLSSTPIDVKVNLVGVSGDLSSQLSGLQKSMQSAGESAGKAFTSGLTSSATGTRSQYARMQAQIANEIKKTSKSMQPVIADTLNSASESEIQRVAQKSATKYVNATVKANDVAQKKIDDAMSKANERTLANFQKNLQNYYTANTKMHQKYGSQVQDILEKSMSPDLTKSGLKELQTEYAKLQRNVVAEGLTGRSFGDELSRGFKQIGQFVGTYGTYMQIVDLMKSMAQEVINVDSAMTELRKVSDASESDLSAYFKQATQDAKDLGSAISDVIYNTADWSKLGYNLPDAQKLSRLTTLYQTVGDNMTQVSASESMISTLQGFQMLPDEAEHIVDSFNEVGNKFAIGSDGIGEALQRSASSMNAAGNTMEETIGLVTAANTVVQDPASVGTAFKTISMRIRGAKTELEEAGEDTEGMAESTAELREELIALSGVDIMKDNNTFKSTYQILDELASKWTDLTDIQQATITELIAGKRQGNIVSALMQNFDIAREATETAMNSEGSAMREQEAYMQSIQYSLDRFKAQFQELSTSFIGSDFLKGLVDGGTEAVGVITDLNDQFGTLGTLLGGAAIAKGTYSFFKNFD